MLSFLSSVCSKTILYEFNPELVFVIGATKSQFEGWFPQSLRCWPSLEGGFIEQEIVQQRFTLETFGGSFFTTFSLLDVGAAEVAPSFGFSFFHFCVKFIVIISLNSCLQKSPYFVYFISLPYVDFINNIFMHSSNSVCSFFTVCKLVFFSIMLRNFSSLICQFLNKI